MNETCTYSLRVRPTGWRMLFPSEWKRCKTLTDMAMVGMSVLVKALEVKDERDSYIQVRDYAALLEAVISARVAEGGER